MICEERVVNYDFKDYVLSSGRIVMFNLDDKDMR